MPLRLVSHTHGQGTLCMHIDIYMCVDVPTHVYVRERERDANTSLKTKNQPHSSKTVISHVEKCILFNIKLTRKSPLSC